MLFVNPPHYSTKLRITSIYFEKRYRVNFIRDAVCTAFSLDDWIRFRWQWVFLIMFFYISPLSFLIEIVAWSHCISQCINAQMMRDVSYIYCLCVTLKSSTKPTSSPNWPCQRTRRAIFLSIHTNAREKHNPAKITAHMHGGRRKRRRVTVRPLSDTWKSVREESCDCAKWIGKALFWLLLMTNVRSAWMNQARKREKMHILFVLFRLAFSV
jgi:hypothetical protein